MPWLNPEYVAKRWQGKTVARAAMKDDQTVVLYFTDGSKTEMHPHFAAFKVEIPCTCRPGCPGRMHKTVPAILVNSWDKDETPAKAPLLPAPPEINEKVWSLVQWTDDDNCDWDGVLAPTSTDGAKEVKMRMNIHQTDGSCGLTIIENTYHGGADHDGYNFTIPLTLQKALEILKQS